MYTNKQAWYFGVRAENTCECKLCQNDRGVQEDDPSYQLGPVCLLCDNGTCMNACMCEHSDECPDNCTTNHARTDSNDEE
jgi:hypothetical protein